MFFSCFNLCLFWPNCPAAAGLFSSVAYKMLLFENDNKRDIGLFKLKTLKISGGDLAENDLINTLRKT